jgi:hypothetical protein
MKPSPVPVPTNKNKKNKKGSGERNHMRGLFDVAHEGIEIGFIGNKP